MHQNDGIETPANSPAHRRWKWAVLCVLIAFGVILHLGQVIPAQAGVNEIQFITVADGTGPCEPGHGSTVGYCHTTAAYSLYALLEANLTILSDAMTHPSLMAEILHLSRAVSPQLHPPKHSFQD